MIVRRNLKISIILKLAWGALLYFFVIALVAAGVQHVTRHTSEIIPPTAIAALSTALAIFLAFRNSSAYDRWWEGRKLWGRLVNTTRVLAQQMLTFVEGDDSLARRVLRRHVAYVHCLRLLLRRQNAKLREELGPWLEGEDLDRALSAPNATAVLVRLQAEDFAAAKRRGALDDFRHMQLDDTLKELLDIQGGCERIKNTPLMRVYDFYPRIFVYVYATLLPFALVKHLGWYTPIVTVPISFLFRALEGVGRTTEDPFEDRFADVPLSALCRVMERDVRHALGERDLPPPLEPVDGFLW